MKSKAALASNAIERNSTYYEFRGYSKYFCILLLMPLCVIQYKHL